jgi:hypothetical protein
VPTPRTTFIEEKKQRSACAKRSQQHCNKACGADAMGRREERGNAVFEVFFIGF